MTTEQNIAGEWPGAGEIGCITFCDIDGENYIAVGTNGVTRIEKWVKSGLHSFIPYVRVWAGDRIYSEHCQHALTGVYFKDG